jgi:adenine deaminase
MKAGSFALGGRIIDVVTRRIFEGVVHVENGVIIKIEEGPVESTQYILPGFIDSHIHIESSMLIPSEFARIAVIHGTVGTVSDPHEIANVLGISGVKFMISNGHKVPFRFNFGAPSCVPATSFESAGATLGPAEIEELLQLGEIRYLSEMMNFPGVLFNDPVVAQKLAIAAKYGKPVDGHAPGLTGENASKYIAAGISTDHECYTLEEAKDKISKGMKVLIREGSAAKNFEALWPLIDEYPGMVMLCSDDKHPNDLVSGHINDLVKRALGKGCDLMNVLRSCTLNPKEHYKLETGLLQPGDPADFIVVEDLENLEVLSTWINGIEVAAMGRTMIHPVKEMPVNNFRATTISKETIALPAAGERIRIIQALDGQLITHEIMAGPKTEGGNVVADTGRDILKLVVKDRYNDSPPAVGFINGFGINNGAIASSVAHDSHNIIAVGSDDESITRAINLVIKNKGGISLVNGVDEYSLALPFGGIMSDEDGFKVASEYQALDSMAKKLGSNLMAPYMTLSFMALLVIPSLKLSDRGLFDVNNFTFTPIFF